MRAIMLLSGLVLAGSATLAVADSVSSTSDAGASVAIVSGSNGGTTIIVDSEHPCRTRNEKAAGAASRGSHSTASAGSHSSSSSVGIGAGGLSGTTTAGPNGTTVTVSPGSGGTTTTTSSGSNVAAAGECVVIIRGPAGK
jgi:hypothetical protein